MTNKVRYFAAVLVPVLILLFMTVLPLRATFFGKEILLETMPLDPTDLFRGDHVVLNYKISQVDESIIPGELKNDESKYFGKNMYAVLKPVGEFYEVERISLDKPDGGVFLKCRYEYREGTQFQPGLKTGGASGTIYHFSYYLDRYFVPENTGTELEKLSQEGKLFAGVKIYGDYALLVRVSENTHNK